jgi:hypothetical protein
METVTGTGTSLLACKGSVSGSPQARLVLGFGPTRADKAALTYAVLPAAEDLSFVGTRLFRLRTVAVSLSAGAQRRAPDLCIFKTSIAKMGLSPLKTRVKRSKIFFTGNDYE